MNKRFIFKELALAGLYTIQRLPIEDDRGFFSRFYCAGEFKLPGFTSGIAQINQSLTIEKGAVRGLHFQYPPHAEVKVVNCVRGCVFDVAVDIRRNSPTFLRWHGEILSAENKTGLLLPEGFAHGFQTLTADCELIYLHSSFYTPEAEGGLNAADPSIGIDWPLPFSDCSERDRQHPLIGKDFRGVEI